MILHNTYLYMTHRFRKNIYTQIGVFGNIIKVARRDARLHRERYSLHSTVGKPRGQLPISSPKSAVPFPVEIGVKTVSFRTHFP